MAWLLCLIATASCSLETDPIRVTFGGRSLDVRYGDGVCLFEAGRPVRCLGHGTLLAYDFTGDGVDDLAVYVDTRDGFRDTFSYLEIWNNNGRPLGVAPSVTAKWKEGHWDWIDPLVYPGLQSRRFKRFMRGDQDPWKPT